MYQDKYKKAKIALSWVCLTMLPGAWCSAQTASSCGCNGKSVELTDNAVKLNLAKEFSILQSYFRLAPVINGDSVPNHLYFIAARNDARQARGNLYGKLLSQDAFKFRKDGLVLNLTPCSKPGERYFQLPLALESQQAVTAPQTAMVTARERFEYAVKVTELDWNTLLVRLAEVAPDKYPFEKFIKHLNKKYDCNALLASSAQMGPAEYIDTLTARLDKKGVNLYNEVYDEYLRRYESPDGLATADFDNALFCLVRRSYPSDMNGAARKPAMGSAVELGVDRFAIEFNPALLHPAQSPEGTQSVSQALFSCRSLKLGEAGDVEVVTDRQVCCPASEIGSTGISIRFTEAVPDLSSKSNGLSKCYFGQSFDDIGVKESDPNAFTGVYVPSAKISLRLYGKDVNAQAQDILISAGEVKGTILLNVDNNDSRKTKVLLPDGSSFQASLKDIKNSLHKMGLEAEVSPVDPFSTGHYTQISVNFRYTVAE